MIAAIAKKTLTIGTADLGYPRRDVLTIEVEYDADGELHMTATAAQRRPGAVNIDRGGQIHGANRLHGRHNTGRAGVPARHVG